MKRTALVFCFFAIFTGAHAQNLVENPGFDLYTTCPAFGQFGSTWIPFWEKPNIASSDYYNFNCPGIQPTVQMPYSGEGYAGIIGYNYGTEYREYITGTFSSPLVAGMLYDVELWVSLNNGYIQAINEMGAFISTTPPGPFANVLHIAVTPQIENTAVALDDTANWMLIYGQFVASGGEQYITIGNFHDDAGTTITQPGTVGSFGAYYFVDNVSVSLVPPTGIQALHQSTPSTKVYMDEDLTWHVIMKAQQEIKFPISFTINTMSGKEIQSGIISESRTAFQAKMAGVGIYIFRFSDSVGNMWTAKASAIPPR